MITERIKFFIQDLVFSLRSYKKEYLPYIFKKIDKRIYNHGGFPICPLCKTEMNFRFSNLMIEPCRDDITFKCKNCFHTLHRGFPITRNEYDFEVNLRQGRSFMKPSGFETGREKIRYRLKELGYLE